ncbi:PF10947 family protein [Vibrio phage phi 1]|uniref:PF10947 family protein n=1 Tax=Vibrio phage phi 1 TaxID=1589297 RepID=A0A0B5GYE0_9CAUD|nr:PF10947 family protein [Vibrio phage phi 1]AJF40691.1 PF10947 family protein [Vibrio phage phi 1]
MAIKLHLVRDDETKVVPYGFSWTTFIFSFWPSLIRKDWWSAFKILLVSFCTTLGLTLAGSLVYHYEGMYGVYLFVYLLTVLIDWVIADKVNSWYSRKLAYLGWKVDWVKTLESNERIREPRTVLNLLAVDGFSFKGDYK